MSTTAELLTSARAAYQQALAGQEFVWGGRRYKAQSISVLESAISRLESKLAAESGAATARRPLRPFF